MVFYRVAAVGWCLKVFRDAGEVVMMLSPVKGSGRASTPKALVFLIPEPFFLPITPPGRFKAILQF